MVRVTSSHSQLSQNDTTTSNISNGISDVKNSPEPDTLSIASSAAAEDFLIPETDVSSPGLPASDDNFQRKFFIMRDTFCSGEVYLLPHPRSGNSALYLLDQHMNPFELMHIRDMMIGKRSIFYGNSVIGDPGQILMFLPVHPLFLALPYLHNKASQNFYAPEEFLEDQNFPALQLLAFNDKLLATLKIAADSECVCNILKFRFNFTRLMEWLKMKLMSLKEAVKANVDAMCEEGPFLESYSLGILADYLSEPIAEMLQRELPMPIDENNADVKKNNDKTKTSTISSRKRIEMDSLIDGLVSSKTVPNKKVKRMSKVLALASKGTHSLRSFFTNAGEDVGEDRAGSCNNKVNKK